MSEVRGQKHVFIMPDPVDTSSWVDEPLTPLRGYVTALKVDTGELWATLSDGTAIHRREVDGEWEDVE